MERRRPKFDDFCIDQDNPDHTGWGYPGLHHAAKIGVPESQDPQGLKRVFYTIYKLHTFPFRYLQNVGAQRPPDFVRPGELHRDEGAKANIYAFVSLLSYVKHGGDLYGKMRNMHVYTAENDEEIPVDATLGEILRGKYGKMDENNPLRVIWIRGKKGRVDQPFPRLPQIWGGGSKKGVIYVPPSEISYDPQDERYEIPYPSSDIDEPPPTYEESSGD